MSPNKQFEIKKIFDIAINNYDISFTNSSLFMMLGVIIPILFFSLVGLNMRIIPNRLQMIAEGSFLFIQNLINENIGVKGQKYFSFIFSLFIFILSANVLGALPYSFSTTSHIIITFSLAMLVFFAIIIIGFSNHGLRFFKVLLPEGVPVWMSPLIIVIELFAFLSRPISLSMRLAANMVVGHILLKVIISFIIMLGVFMKIFPFGMSVLLVGFELFVAILQAYIFTVLSCVYLNDAINLH